MVAYPTILCKNRPSLGLDRFLQPVLAQYDLFAGTLTDFDKDYILTRTAKRKRNLKFKLSEGSLDSAEGLSEAFNEPGLSQIARKPLPQRASPTHRKHNLAQIYIIILNY